MFGIKKKKKTVVPDGMSFEVRNFKQDVLEPSYEKPVLVDFWAAWCGPCRMLGPVLEKLAVENQDDWSLVKVDTEQHQRLAVQYKIRSIPAVKLFKNGEVVDEFNGALPEFFVRRWIKKAIKP